MCIAPHNLTRRVVALYVQLDGSPEALAQVAGHPQGIAVTETHLRAQQVLVELTRIELDLLKVPEDSILKRDKQLELVNDYLLLPE